MNYFKKHLKWIIIVGLIIAVAVAIVMMPPPNKEALAIGDNLPEFRLKDLEGNEFFSNQYKGKVMLINFWATWCTYCIEEQPELQRLSEKYGGEDFQTVAMLQDDNNIDYAIQLKDKSGVTFPILIDKSKKIFDIFGVGDNLPYTLLVDRSGKIRFIHAGFSAKDIQAYEKEILQLIEEGK